jgi:ABC-type lipoprotein release transport system permease subunit
MLATMGIAAWAPARRAARIRIVDALAHSVTSR